MSLDLAGREGDAVVRVAVIAIEAVAVVVEDAEPPVVPHATEDQLAELRVDASPDALEPDGIRGA